VIRGPKSKVVLGLLAQCLLISVAAENVSDVV